jgi:dihydroflavonol-4-reductase
MKILITGANGFLGSWVTRELIKKGHQVRILVRPTSDLSELEGLTYEKAFGDVTDVESIVKALEGMDSIFHLAGVIAYKKHERANMERVNVGGTANVIEACERTGVKNLLHLSSVVAIGAGLSKNQVLNETSPYNIHHLNLGYFETKHEAENIVIEAHEKGIVEAVIVNPSTIYGPGDGKKGSRKIQIKVAQGKFPLYTSGGVNVIDIDDVLFGIMSAWEKRLTGERFILAGENLLIKDLFATIAAAAGVKPPTIHMPTPLLFTIGFLGDLQTSLGFKGGLSVENARSSILYHWFDNSKAKRMLGLNPKPAKFAIEKSVSWMRAHHLLDK